MNKTSKPTTGSSIGMENFSRWLLRIRTRKKETQEQLARSVGLDRKSIVAFETGSRVPKLDIVMQIAEHYGLKEISFRMTDEAPEPSPKIAYLCDGLREECKEIGCGVCQKGDFQECYRTTDIKHAVNFKRVGFNNYIEVYKESDNLKNE